MMGRYFFSVGCNQTIFGRSAVYIPIKLAEYLFFELMIKKVWLADFLFFLKKNCFIDVNNH